MTAPKGTIAWPGAEAGPVRAFADSLRRSIGRFEHVDDLVDRAAVEARRNWEGIAADSFGHHMNDRGHVFELAADRCREAVEALDRYAAVIDRELATYSRAVHDEQRAADRGDRYAWQEAVAIEGRSVGDVINAGAACAGRLDDLATLVDEYTRRSFIAVGERLSERTGRGLTGDALIIDTLLATEGTLADGRRRIEQDEIQIRRLSDGSYIVVLPGVTDLTSNLTTPWKWITGGPRDVVRKTANASDTVITGGHNPYADAVKVAMQRAGVPDGATVTLVGHSYGSYTAVDLAADPTFNSIDGDLPGYDVRVSNVFGFAGDVDWKFDEVPAATNVVALNSRDDVVYQAETRFHPETGEVVRRGLFPGVDLLPVPWYRPTVEYPSGRANQMEVRINAGRVEFAERDGYWSGHHPENYADAVPQVGDRPGRFYRDATGDARVVETFNVRVPDAPRDTVPPTRR